MPFHLRVRSLSNKSTTVYLLKVWPLIKTIKEEKISTFEDKWVLNNIVEFLAQLRRVIHSKGLQYMNTYFCTFIQIGITDRDVYMKNDVSCLLFQKIQRFIYTTHQLCKSTWNQKYSWPQVGNPLKKTTVRNLVIFTNFFLFVL